MENLSLCTPVSSHKLSDFINLIIVENGFKWWAGDGEESFFVLFDMEVWSVPVYYLVLRIIVLWHYDRFLKRSLEYATMRRRVEKPPQNQIVPSIPDIDITVSWYSIIPPYIRARA